MNGPVEHAFACRNIACPEHGALYHLLRACDACGRLRVLAVIWTGPYRREPRG